MSVQHMNVRQKNLLTACQALETLANSLDKWHPHFHLFPKTGWLNDPNGLCVFGGKYHIFYQYSPFAPAPGLNYWGHFATKDFVRYQAMPPALCCDESFDCHGVYSGSAVVRDDLLHVFYTGNVKQTDKEYDYILAGREHNTVHAVSRDGIYFSQKRVVLKNDDYPSDASCHVRDPKVYPLGDGYVMLLGARTRADTGEVLLYTSMDLLHWKQSGTVTAENRLGYMWECPDLLTAGEERFLLFCPQGVPAQGLCCQNVYQSGYAPLIGDFPGDCKIGTFTELDHGFDFYAPQTMLDAQGRRLLIGWAGLPDLDGVYDNPTKQNGWVHCLTVPREITVQDGKLLQQPIKELVALRQDRQQLMLAGTAVLPQVECFDCELMLSSDDGFCMEVRKSVRLDYENGVFSLTFQKNGYGRTRRAVRLTALKALRILCDTSVLEVFVNYGEAVFTTRFYPDENDCGIQFQRVSGTASIWQMGQFTVAEE